MSSIIYYFSFTIRQILDEATFWFGQLLDEATFWFGIRGHTGKLVEYVLGEIDQRLNTPNRP